MTQLSDFLRSYGIQKAADYCRSDPAFTVFNLLWSDPEQLIPACEKMGWQTLDDLMAWIGKVNLAIGNTNSFVDLIDPPISIDYTSLPTISYTEIHDLIKAQCNIRDDWFYDISDATYRLPTKEMLVQLAATNPHRTKKWVETRNDCEDFVRAFMGWLAANNMGNLAIGFCNQTPHKAGAMIGGHAVAIAVDQDKKVWIIEPQAPNGLLLDPKSLTAARLGGYWSADSMKLARVFF